MTIAPVLVKKKSVEFDVIPRETLDLCLAKPQGLCKYLMEADNPPMATHKKNGNPYLWFDALWLIESKHFKIGVEALALKLGLSKQTALVHIKLACKIVNDFFGLPLVIFENKLIMMASDQHIQSSLQKETKKLNSSLKKIGKTWNYALNRGRVDEDLLEDLNQNLELLCGQRVSTIKNYKD